jgi:hypothetical protein
MGADSAAALGGLRALTSRQPWAWAGGVGGAGGIKGAGS